MTPPFVWAVPYRRQPVHDVVAHHILPSHHETCVPGMLVGLGLHDDIGASWTALDGIEDWPVVVILRFILRRGC